MAWNPETNLKGPKGDKGDQGDQGPIGPIGPEGPPGEGIEAGTLPPTMNGTAAPGVSLVYSREDHVHPTDTSRAAAAHTHLWADITDKPSTFVPSAHTHLWADITDKPATFTPSAHTHAQSEVTNLVTDLGLKAPLASPALTGSPTAPTPSVADYSTKIATTEFVNQAQIIPATVDLNTIVKPGTYALAGANNNPNEPTGAGQWYFHVISYGSSADYLVQDAISLLDGSQRYVRVRIGTSTWQAWQKMAPSADVSLKYDKTGGPISGSVSVTGNITASGDIISNGSLWTTLGGTTNQGVIYFGTNGVAYQHFTSGNYHMIGGGIVGYGNLAIGSPKLSFTLSNGYFGLGVAAPATFLHIDTSTGIPADNSAILLSDAAVAHGLTGIHPTSVWGSFVRASSTAGGLIVRGIEDSGGAGTPGLILDAMTGSTAPVGFVGLIRAFKRSGTGLAPLATNEGVLEIQNGGSGLIRVLGNGNTSFLSTTASSSPTTGAVTIAGGLGVSDGIRAGNYILALQGYFNTGVAPPAGSTGAIAFAMGNTFIGMYFGTGAPSFTAPKGSLYINNTATTTTTRLYINTNGSTTWTNFTTAA